MKRAGCKPAFLAVLCFLPIACAARRSPVVLDTRGVKPAVDYSDLAAVLKEAFDDGELYPSRLKPLTGRLDAQLKRLAVTGPNTTARLFPTSESRLAYWYNARAAWAIKLAQLAGFPERVDTDSYASRRFPLDGRTSTLDGIDRILASRAGWQAVVAAPGLCLKRAKMPATPFSEKDIRPRIRERFGQFVDDPRRFVIDVFAERVRVPRVLWQFRRRIFEDLREDYAPGTARLTSALLRYVTGSAQRRLQDAVGYTCVPARPGRKLAVFREKE